MKNTDLENAVAVLYIIETNKETFERTVVSLDYAIEKLNAYWTDYKILEILLKGQTLWTPDSYFSIYINTINK